MKILLDIGHPAHVHFFRPALHEWQKQGYEVLITARKKGGVIELLDYYNLKYLVTSEQWSGGALRQLAKLLGHTWRLWRTARQFRPSLILSISSPMAAWVSLLSGIPHWTFDDTEHATLEHRLYRPGAKRIYTPLGFTKDLGPKQVKYPGFHELAYLHPNRFAPNPEVLKRAGLEPGERFFVVRTVAWTAAHDIGQHGLTPKDVERLLEILRSHGKVAISREGSSHIGIGSKKLHPRYMHDLLYYATLYIGEGGTMATEAALLGTPSIFVNTLTASNWQELEHTYGLMYSFKSGVPAIAKVEELLNKANLGAGWQEKRERLLKDKIDVTQYVVDEVQKFWLAKKS
ncbi:MAG: DUF354 domain-containing protein [Anaerolineales bacterium]|nr:DUF354 domain-containing protein [Anaerolineales bacterium]